MEGKFGGRLFLSPISDTMLVPWLAYWWHMYDDTFMYSMFERLPVEYKVSGPGMECLWKTNMHHEPCHADLPHP